MLLYTLLDIKSLFIYIYIIKIYMCIATLHVYIYIYIHTLPGSEMVKVGGIFRGSGVRWVFQYGRG